MELNRQLPRITQRDVLSRGRFDYSFYGPGDKPGVGTVRGSRLKKKFVAVSAPRQIVPGLQGTG
jgi:hypothetical protein